MKEERIATTQGREVTLQLVAKNIAFNVSTLRAPAAAHVKIAFDNRDEGIPHNFALYTDETATRKLFAGKIITGPARIDYELTAPGEKGSYFFRCDVHPRMMTGNFIVG